MEDLSTIKLEDLDLIDHKRMLVNARDKTINDKDWCRSNAEYLDNLLNHNGALLIRGLKFPGSKKLDVTLSELFKSETLEYNYRSTPRTRMRGNVYTSSEYPSQETIVQHNEASYSNTWPMRIGFCCVKAPLTGGQTPIADSHNVYNRVPDSIKELFEQKKLKYVRNYSEIDLPWTEVFQTTKKGDVEEYCLKNNIEFQWMQDGSLRTQQINEATIRHPVNGKKVWFNQAHLFHISSLPKSNQEDLLAMYGEEKLPRNVYFGDGTPISSDILDQIRSIYQEEIITFDWLENDLLLLDNILFSHGRNPFSGDRKILVGMARPCCA